jgi:hypothetical protein
LLRIVYRRNGVDPAKIYGPCPLLAVMLLVEEFFHSFPGGGGRAINSPGGGGRGINSPGGGGRGINSPGGGGRGEYDAHARTKNEMKQAPEIKVRRKFPTSFPITPKRKLKPEIMDHIAFRLICLIFLSFL